MTEKKLLKDMHATPEHKKYKEAQRVYNERNKEYQAMKKELILIRAELFQAQFQRRTTPEFKAWQVGKTFPEIFKEQEQDE